MKTISKLDYNKNKYSDVHQAISDLVVAYGVYCEQGADVDGMNVFDTTLKNVYEARVK